MNPMFDPKFVHSLPIIAVKVGDEMIRVRYDEESGYMFRLDAQDRWNGEMTKGPAKKKEEVQQPPKKTEIPQAEPIEIDALVSPPSETEQARDVVSAGMPTNSNEAAQEKTPEDISKPDPEVSSAQPEQSQGNNEKPSFIKSFVYVVFGILALAAIIMTTFAGKGGKEQEIPNTSLPSETTAPSQIQETQSVIPEETQMPTETESYELLITTRAMIPGEVITEDNITGMPVTEETYRQLSTSMGLYTLEDVNQLIGLVAINYIPEGRYLTYDDIGITYAPQNPWVVGETELVEFVLPVHIPANQIHTLGWGYHADMTITVQTKQTNDNSTNPEEEETAPPSGLEHESSILESMVVDTYKLQNVPIMDLLNADQESLYRSYMALAQIPSAFMKPYLLEHYSDPQVLQAVIPYYIKVFVTKEQATVLATLDPATMTVAVQKAAAHNITAVQNEQSVKLQDVLKVVAANADLILQEESQ